jgi:auxin efflux carrier family protein
VGISFVSIFIVAFNIAFFPCGFGRSIAWDYLPRVPQGKDAEIRYSWREKPLSSRILKVLSFTSKKKANSNSTSPRNSLSNAINVEPGVREDNNGDEKAENRIETTSPTQTVESHEEENCTLKQQIIHRSSYLLHTVILNPCTISLIISLPIALVPQLKALFVDISGSGGPNWKGPDGQPPLAFVINTGKQCS